MGPPCTAPRRGGSTEYAIIDIFGVRVRSRRLEWRGLDLAIVSNPEPMRSLCTWICNSNGTGAQEIRDVATMTKCAIWRLSYLERPSQASALLIWRLHKMLESVNRTCSRIPPQPIGGYLSPR